MLLKVIAVAGADMTRMGRDGVIVGKLAETFGVGDHDVIICGGNGDGADVHGGVGNGGDGAIALTMAMIIVKRSIRLRPCDCARAAVDGTGSL